MIYCKSCGSITDGKTEHETFEPGYGTEYRTCSLCGSDRVEEARQCPICGDYHQDKYEPGCEECRDRIYNEYVRIFEESESYGECGIPFRRDKILEIMASVFDDFYNKYL